MTRAVPLIVCGWLAASAAIGAGALPAPVAESGFDRPAMWVADRVTYSIEIVCPPGVDILTEDLAPEKLTLLGLDIVGSDTVRRDEATGTRYRFAYVLTTFDVATPRPSVGSLPVRYYAGRPGQRPAQAAPAGAIYVPGAAITFRSLLPDGEFADVRDGRAVPARRLRFRLLGLAGAGALLVAAAAILSSFAGRLRRDRRAGAARGPSVRQVRRTARAAFEELQRLDPRGSDARRDAFARLEAAVRQHLAMTCGVAAAGLTPDELAMALEASDARPPMTLLASVLDACERAKYADPAGQPSDAEWRATLTSAAQLLAPPS